ncbi:MAG: NADH:flavin oxidoreductase [Caulobacteraceae bacterium]|nr:NADH:flavin oxidoreductase [Caulobacteraceae bacterium]
MTPDPFQPLTLTRGPTWRNRFMLAPLTNSQSLADGRLSEDEFRWLTYRAEGGFGLVMTCAAHVQRVGQGFPGQLGVFGDEHLEGLTRLADAIRADGAVSAVQLHHAGIRAPEALTGEAPHGPSDHADTGARALLEGEVEALVEDFVAAAVRAERAGFDGVELHGAHSYILCGFLSPELNRRTDRYGGSLENRARVLVEVIAGIRGRTRPDFQLGLRLSAERFGLRLAEQREVASWMMASGDLDYLDLSLWDVFGTPQEPEFADRPLIDWFTDLPRHGTRVGVAGKLMDGAAVRRVLEHGADFPILGRAAILHHDFPIRLRDDPGFASITTPIPAEHLAAERLSPAFIHYMSSAFKGFVAPSATVPG